MTCRCCQSPGRLRFSRSHSLSGAALTSLSPPLLGAVDVVFQLVADLPVVGQFPDEGVLAQLLRVGSLAGVLHQAELDERLELPRPAARQSHKFKNSFFIVFFFTVTGKEGKTKISLRVCRFV